MVNWSAITDALNPIVSWQCPPIFSQIERVVISHAELHIIILFFESEGSSPQGVRTHPCHVETPVSRLPTAGFSETHVGDVVAVRTFSGINVTTSQSDILYPF